MLAFRCWLGTLGVHNWRDGLGDDGRGDGWGGRLEEAHAIILSLAYGSHSDSIKGLCGCSPPARELAARGPPKVRTKASRSSRTRVGLSSIKSSLETRRISSLLLKVYRIANMAVRRSASKGRAPALSQARVAPYIAARLLAYRSPWLSKTTPVMSSFPPNCIS